MRNKGKKSLRRRLSECAALCAAALFLWGCAGVEPEKRAYPLAVSVDYINGEYEVVYGMANLPADTGQGKDPQAGGAEQNAGTVFRGKDLKEIQKLYDASQEYDLDLGHVQAVVLGKRLLSSEDASSYIFQYMEDNTVLGKSAYLFQTEDPDALMKLNGTTVDSLGDYLTGLYENRTGIQTERPLTLENFLYTWNNYDELPAIPEILVRDGQIILEKTV